MERRKASHVQIATLVGIVALLGFGWRVFATINDRIETWNSAGSRLDDHARRLTFLETQFVQFQAESKAQQSETLRVLIDISRKITSGQEARKRNANDVEPN